jgi:hypothetical protein
VNFFRFLFTAPDDGTVPEYEAKRLENIKRNRELIAALGLHKPPSIPLPIPAVRSEVQRYGILNPFPLLSISPPSHTANFNIDPITPASRAPVSRKRKAPGKLLEFSRLSPCLFAVADRFLFLCTVTAIPLPSPKRRTSSRLRGLPPATPIIADPDALALGGVVHVASEHDGESGAPESSADTVVFELTGPLPAEQFFPANVCEKAIRADGHYSGWLEPELQARLGLASSAEQEGGGTYSHRNPLGNNDNVGRGGARPAGWSTAKWTAWRGMRKNPNAFFYRHVEPGKAQRLDQFDEQETEVFLKVRQAFLRAHLKDIPFHTLFSSSNRPILIPLLARSLGLSLHRLPGSMDAATNGVCFRRGFLAVSAISAAISTVR